MRDGVVFLNSARAQLHDTDALVDALRGGKVAAAGLDHFVGEWLPTDHPLIAMPNVVLTPHIGGATWNTEARQAQMVADDLEALLSGNTPAHIVNPEVLGPREICGTPKPRCWPRPRTCCAADWSRAPRATSRRGAKTATWSSPPPRSTTPT